MHEQQIRIKINNITNAQRAVYRALRRRMGLQRQEANFTMLGYIMAEDAMKVPITGLVGLAEYIFKKAGVYENDEVENLIHDWQHAVANYLENTPVNKVTVRPQE